MGGVGIEPTETEVNGVTDRPSSPTLAPAHISSLKVSWPRIHLASHICSRRKKYEQYWQSKKDSNLQGDGAHHTSLKCPPLYRFAHSTIKWGWGDQPLWLWCKPSTKTCGLVHHTNTGFVNGYQSANIIDVAVHILPRYFGQPQANLVWMQP